MIVPEIGAGERQKKQNIVGRGTSYSYQEFIIKRREYRTAIVSHDLKLALLSKGLCPAWLSIKGLCPAWLSKGLHVSSMAEQGPVSSRVGQGPASSRVGQGPVSSRAEQGPMSSRAEQGPMSSMAEQGPVSSMACVQHG